jgi:hypothetical protein
MFLPFVTSPEGDSLCGTTTCPLSANLASVGSNVIPVALVISLVVAVVGYLTSTRFMWALVALLASGAALILGLVEGLAEPGTVLPYTSSAPISTGLGFWVFVPAAALASISALGMVAGTLQVGWWERHRRLAPPRQSYLAPPAGAVVDVSGDDTSDVVGPLSVASLRPESEVSDIGSPSF